MDVLANVLPFGVVLGALAIGLIAVQRQQRSTQELQFVRVRAGRGRRR